MASVGRRAPSIIHLTQCKSRAGLLFVPSISSAHFVLHSRKPPKLSLPASSAAFHITSFLGSVGFYRRFSAAPTLSKKPNRKNIPILSALVEVGGVKITRDDVVRENDPTNNVPDSIFAKIGLQLHRRDNHPLGILKNEIYNFFDNNFTESFNKFDNLCPIVSVKAVIKHFHPQISWSQKLAPIAEDCTRCVISPRL